MHALLQVLALAISVSGAHLTSGFGRSSAGGGGLNLQGGVEAAVNLPTYSSTLLSQSYTSLAESVMQGPNRTSILASPSGASTSEVSGDDLLCRQTAG